MNYEIKESGDTTIVAFSGNIFFNHLLSSREAIYKEITGLASPIILVDLSDVPMIDSTGVGFLIYIYKSVKSRNGTIAFINPNENLIGVFGALGLNKVFAIHETTDAAMKAQRAGK